MVERIISMKQKIGMFYTTLILIKKHALFICTGREKEDTGQFVRIEPIDTALTPWSFSWTDMNEATPNESQMKAAVIEVFLHGLGGNLK
jgi:hypothetical protein